MSAIHQYLTEQYGSIKRAARVFDVNYITLQRNAKDPKGSWAIVDKIINGLLAERDEALLKAHYTEEEYSRLAREYNDLIDRYSRREEEII